MTETASNSTLKDLSVVPLSSLTAVCLDTETTGLDTVVARVVQLGAVKIVAGGVDRGLTFDRLVNPGIPIPPSTSRIHHIYDADVSSADDFPIALERFKGWSDEEIVIGYSIGFDLAILEAESGRSNLPWQKPRWLDVRHLAQLLEPSDKTSSLEATATWLGIPVVNRHSALGDALLTAEIFVALIPKLRELKIITLAQAERACLGLLSQHEIESKAGWAEIHNPAASITQSIEAYARIDSYPYRHKVRDVMSAPARSLTGSALVRDVIQTLMNDRISSVFVETGDPKNAFGIVTERDILGNVNDHASSGLGFKVSEIMSVPLLTIEEDEYVYRAIGRMTSENIRHLAVVNNDGQLVGALSSRDLLHQRADNALSLGDNIEKADTAGELGHIWADLTKVARGLVAEEVDARDVAAIISRELRALTEHASRIAERLMKDQGRGEPPCPYAVMVLGSGGRGESLLAMDQDNAIVFADGGDEAANDKWFQELGEHIADILNSVGVEYCDGGIMAKNAAWRMTVSDWHKKIAEWIDGATPEDIMNSDIFFDSRSVHGDLEMGEQLRQEALNVASRSKNFLQQFALQAADFQIPISWFGRLQTHEGRIDLKKGGIMPIFSAARVLALKKASPAHSTPKRLMVSYDDMEHGQHIVDNVIEAHRILLDLTLKQQLRDLETGVNLSNRVSPSQLTSREKNSLKWAFSEVNGISDLLGARTEIW